MREYKLRVLLSTVMALSLLVGACSPASQPTLPAPSSTHTPTSTPASTLTADILFFNGQVVTMDSDRVQTEALAVLGEDILAVGLDEEILALSGPETEVIDLDGRTLLPGFVDSHTHIFNDRAKAALNEYIPNGTLEEAQDLAIKLGITTLADMWVDRRFLEEFKVFEPNLKVRTKLYLVYNSNCGDVFGPWWTSELPLTSTSGRLQVTPGVKIYSDGGTCGKAPAMTVELRPDYYGDLFMTEEQLVDVITDMDARGLQVAIHAIGDRAIETVLDALETVLAGQPNTLRHRIEHNNYIRPDLLPRYGQIGVVPSVWNSQACWINDVADVDPDGEFILTCRGGPKTHPWNVPWRSLIDQNPGIKLAWQSDTPWVGFSPITDLYSLVTRNQVKVYKDYGVGPVGTVCNAPDWLAKEAITREEALEMMTINSAYALHMDDVVGSLEPGKHADLVVLSNNPLSVTEDELKDLEVLLTMIGGVVEYRALEPTPAEEEILEKSPVMSENDDSIQPTEPPWPMFHGNLQRTGLSQYDTSHVDGTIKWTFETVGGMESSPAIGIDGIIYVGTHDGYLYAVFKNGKEKWKVKIATPKEKPGHGVYTSISSSPAVDKDGTIYIASRDQYLHAISSQGKEIWKFPIGVIPFTWASPAIGEDGTIYITSSVPKAGLFAINSDGTEKWRFATAGPVESSPAIGADGTIYFGVSLTAKGNPNFHALNPDGTEKWHFTEGGGVSSPAIGADGTIYFGSADSKLYAIGGSSAD